MPYYVTENFAAGIDTRKHPLTAPPGTLRQLLNAHLTPGGEIEKRLAFVKAHTPAPVPLERGLCRVGSEAWIVTAGAPGADVPYNLLTFRYLQLTGVPVDAEVLDWDVFDGRIYIVAQLSDDVTVQHYYQDVDASDPPVPQSTASLVPEGRGRFIRTYQKKMYSCAGKTIYYSAIGDPTIWDPGNAGGTGQGFIDAATNDAEAIDLSGIEVYYDQLAFFSSRAIQLWQMDADPANNLQSQTIRSIGIAARATPRQYGPGDILFVAPSGIRSLQARDSSNSASVSDVGSPIDEDITLKIRRETQNFINDAQSMLEDLTGRFWVMFRDEIYVLSLFPGPKVSAWSRYLTSFNDGNGQEAFFPETLVDAAGYVCILGKDTSDVPHIFVMGGPERGEYDDCPVEVQTSYINLDRPASWKQFLAIDAAVDGTWHFEVSYDPDVIFWEPCGTLTKSSYNDQRQALRGQSPAISMKMTNNTAERARIANIAVHYSLSKDD